MATRRTWSAGTRFIGRRFDRERVAALIRAAGQGYLDLVQFSIERGADVRQSFKAREWGQSRNGHQDGIDYPRRIGAAD